MSTPSDFPLTCRRAMGRVTYWSFNMVTVWAVIMTLVPVALLADSSLAARLTLSPMTV